MNRLPALFSFLFALNFVFGTSASFAQDADNIRVNQEGQMQILTTKSGSEIIGRITAIGDENITFTTDVGVLIIKVVQIKSVQAVPLSAFHGGVYWPPDYNISRHYFGPTGINLKEGTGYYQNIYLLFNGFSYGLTDRLTIGAGTFLLPGAVEDQPYFMTAKIGIGPTGKETFAIGALAFAAGGNSFGILFGAATIGSGDRNLTLGIGYGYNNSDLAETPTVMVAFERRLSRRMKFISENYILPGVDGALVSYGFRFFGEKLAIDLAFINFTPHPFWPGVPYVDFVFNF